MWNNLINLLPQEYVRELNRGYLLRLATVAIWALIALVLFNGAMLIPSYILVHQEVGAQSRILNESATTNATAEEKQLNQELAALASETKYLSNLSGVPSASNSLKAVLAVQRTGISIASLSYTAPANGKQGTLLITGNASTRETLHAYTVTLSGLSFISNVDLPISDYAQASNIPFTITLTGKFTP